MHQLLVCQAAHSAALQVAGIQQLVNKWQRSGIERTATQPPLAKRQLQRDKPPTNLSAYVLYAQHTTRLPGIRSVELPKK